MKPLLIWLGALRLSRGAERDGWRRKKVKHLIFWAHATGHRNISYESKAITAYDTKHHHKPFVIKHRTKKIGK